MTKDVAIHKGRMAMQKDVPLAKALRNFHSSRAYMNAPRKAKNGLSRSFEWGYAAQRDGRFVEQEAT